MATEAQVSANRRNAAKSTGPKTTRGKAIVAQNAIRHGLLARRNVIPGEEQQEFDLHRREVIGELTPAGKIEICLAERIVGLTWRLQRAERLQNEVFESLLAKELKNSMEYFRDELSPEDEVRLRSDPGTDPIFAVGRMVARDFCRERTLDRLLMYERQIEGSLLRIMKELRGLRREQKPQSADGEAVSKLSGLRIAGGMSATPPPAGQEKMTDSAKQSQSQAPEPDHRLAETQNVASLRLDEAAGTAASDSAKQSQSAEDSPCETKPMDSEVPSSKSEVSGGDPALQTSHLTLDTPRETPDGVTTNAGGSPEVEGRLCETKPIRRQEVR